MGKILSSSFLALTGLVCAQVAWTAPVANREATQARFDALRAQMKSGPSGKLGSQLALMERAATAAALQRRAGGSSALASKLRVLLARDGYVVVSAYPDDPADAAALRASLVSKGMLDAAVRGNAVTGRVPFSALTDLSNTQGLRFLRPAMAKTRTGLVTSQGDRSMRSDVARKKFGVTGKGVRIGVMSDSYNCLEGPLFEGQPFTTAADDMKSHDLPRDVVVLKDLSDVPSPDCTDEGRAIMQLMHDVAPGSSFAFYTAFESVEDFADGIRALAKAGANIIVDDVIYFEEPMFLDGAIALAGEQVVSRGVAFFSSAGNDARQSYESPFRESRKSGISGKRHDFDPGKRVDTLQSVTATAGSVSLLSFQWDQPFFSVTGGAGSASDLDAYFVDADGVPIEMCTDDPDQLVCQFPGLDANVGGDAVEFPILINFSDADLEAQLAIEVFEGPKPKLMKYVYFDLDAGSFLVNEYDTQSGSAYGHANGAGIEAVGAAGFYNTAAFGQNKPECGPACLQNFSSAGGVPILFDKKGRRLLSPEIRLTPGVTGPDGGDTTFFYSDLTVAIPGTDEPNGNPNFFGTSASAPHVAAVGALMLEKRRRADGDQQRNSESRDLSPEAMYRALRLTAGDIRFRAGITSGPFEIEHSSGYDFDSGYGFVDAVRAIQFVSGN